MKTDEKGRIIKALAGFYYIDDGKTIHQCRARGKFRKEDIKPVVGDFVEFQSGSHDDGYLLKHYWYFQEKNQIFQQHF